MQDDAPRTTSLPKKASCRSGKPHFQTGYSLSFVNEYNNAGDRVAPMFVLVLTSSSAVDNDRKADVERDSESDR